MIFPPIATILCFSEMLSFERIKLLIEVGPFVSWGTHHSKTCPWLNHDSWRICFSVFWSCPIQRHSNGIKQTALNSQSIFLTLVQKNSSSWHLKTWKQNWSQFAKKKDPLDAGLVWLAEIFHLEQSIHRIIFSNIVDLDTHLHKEDTNNIPKYICWNPSLWRPAPQKKQKNLNSTVSIIFNGMSLIFQWNSSPVYPNWMQN